jgi:hypothetical protein
VRGGQRFLAVQNAQSMEVTTTPMKLKGKKSAKKIYLSDEEFDEQEF